MSELVALTNWTNSTERNSSPRLRMEGGVRLCDRNILCSQDVLGSVRTSCKCADSILSSCVGRIQTPKRKTEGNIHNPYSVAAHG